MPTYAQNAATSETWIGKQEAVGLKKQIYSETDVKEAI